MCEVQLSLKNELKSYGLNPAEWNLRKLNKQRFKIVHIDDDNFYFVGKTKPKGPTQQWATVQLISI
jgi:hypothetical protein